MQCRRRRTFTPPRSPRTSSCWRRTPEAWPAIGGLRRSFAPSGAARRWAWRRGSGSSASSTSAGRCRKSSRRTARRWPTRSPTSTDGHPRLLLSRSDELEALSTDSFDVVIIGGGITGAGVALDAASRGYSVALVERDDYASGTSSRSSKLVHGGLRYLQNFDLGLVREALLERALMVNLAPHLVHPLPLLVPGFDGKRPDRLTGVGLNMYHVMAREGFRRRAGEEEWSPDRHRMIPGQEAVELIPALESRNPTSAYLFYDCQTDDVRLVLTVLGEAERFGAVAANRCEVSGLIERAGRAAGVLVRDGVGGGKFELRADNVVSATGVWADRIRPDEIYAEEEVPRIRPSRGTHITLPHDKLPLT